MNATGSKTRKKTSPKTPGRGQQKLSSFFTKRSSLTDGSAGNNLSCFSKSHTESQTSIETGKKRKFGQSYVNSDCNQSKSKKTAIYKLDINNSTTSIDSSDVTKHNNDVNDERGDSSINKYAVREVIDKPLSKSGVSSHSQKEDISAVEMNREKLPGDLMYDKENSSSPESYSPSKTKNNGFNNKVDEKSKKFSALKTDSQNIQCCLSYEQENNISQNSSMNKKLDENYLPKQAKCELSESTNYRENSNDKKMENDIARSEKAGTGFADDDCLFDAFDKSFSAEDEIEKSSKDSGCNSQSICTTLTDEFEDIFSDDWNGDMEEDVDLSNLQRCKVLNTTRDKFNNLIVNVVHVESQIPVTVTFTGFWKEVRVRPDDFINIQAYKQSNAWIVDNNNGFVIEQPDYLVSGTSVVGALFCARRGVLSDKFKGVDSITDCKQGSSVMVIGSLVHELLQEVLKKKIHTISGIRKLSKDILNSRNTATMLYSASMSTETCEKEMSHFVPKIFHFIERYVKDKRVNKPMDENFNGRINKVRDIEENLWVPQFGIKGKVDVTLEVNVNLRSRIMPLELKTGRASFSLEHRGQIILYTMMMAVTGQDVEAGLLLYLRENIMREIKVGHPEKRDLILLRNNLAYYLTRKPEVTNQADSELKSKPEIESMELPGPIDHRACRNCPYSVLCCAYLKDDDNYKLNDRHPLNPIINELDNYLKPEHIEYVKKWVKMLQIEEADQLNAVQPLRLIWTVPPAEREKKGKCISNLKLIGEVIEEQNRYLHTFGRIDSENPDIIKDLTKSGFVLMEYIIVSTNTRVNVCAGPITEISEDSISLLLERNLAQKKPNEIFHIDGYTSQSLLTLNLSNIGYLLDDNAVTEKLRKIVIERKPASFLKNLDRSLLVVAREILQPLNKMQQKAVLKVIAAHDYLLIKGMPGSGKTVTLVAIIELLVKLGKSVLITAHTHSAVDNVLLKLIKTDVDFVRLGSTAKIHPLLLSKSEFELTRECCTPESLDAAYNSKNVVCVTCLGASHPLFGKRMFDVCLVDESTQVLQSSVLRALYSASKFVLIGDPDQLPPVVKSNVARELGMDQSLFERLDDDNNTITLTSQYRMNQRIMSVANKVTYKGQLTIDTDEIGHATLNIPNKTVLNSSQQWVRDALSTDLDNSVVVLDTGDKYNILRDDMSSKNADYRNRRCSNLCEAAVILQLTTTLIEAGVEADKIGIIAPYREQVSLLRATVENNVEVNTVDQYQGRDKEIIFYSGTRSATVRSDMKRDFDILDDHRRLTVAITRAKHKLIIIGDVNNLKQFVPFKKLFNQVREKDLIVLENGSSDFMWEELLSILKK